MCGLIHYLVSLRFYYFMIPYPYHPGTPGKDKNTPHHPHYYYGHPKPGFLNTHLSDLIEEPLRSNCDHIKGKYEE
jgi:hypothetical protein